MKLKHLDTQIAEDSHKTLKLFATQNDVGVLILASEVLVEAIKDEKILKKALENVRQKEK